MPESSDPAATKKSPRPISLRRRWLFRIVAILLALVPFVLFELILRWCGYGYDTRFIVRAPGTRIPSSYSFNPAIDRAYFGRGDLPGPQPRPFQLPKPAGVYRIVVVGGSSVAGFPYPSELSFPRHLEIVLQEQNPGRQIEVLNAGITAISSFSEIDIARQATKCSPDLMIVHSGHNEFYGVGGLTSNAGGVWTGLYPLLEQVRRQRLFQLCASFLQTPVDKDLLEALPTDIAIPLDGTIFNQVQDYYRANLNRIVNHVVASRVPLLLTTVPANLRDLSPMSSLSSATLTSEQMQQQAARTRRITERLSYQEFEAALPLIKTCRELDPHNALLAYREAQCLEKLQHRRESAARYAEAADLDGCRFRAPSHFATIVRDTVARYPNAVLFCDVAKLLQARSQYPAPGNDFFLEHVHYNIDGHWTVAQILGQYIQTEILHSEWNPQLVPNTARRDELLGLTTMDHIMGDTFALMALRTWPLKTAPDSKRQIGLAMERLRVRYAGLTELDQRLFADLSLAGMQQDLLIAMGKSYQNAGEFDRAVRMFETNMLRRPWDVRGYLNAAAILQQQGKLQRSAEILDRLQRLVPSDRQVTEQLEQLRQQLH